MEFDENEVGFKLGLHFTNPYGVQRLSSVDWLQLCADDAEVVPPPDMKQPAG